MTVAELQALFEAAYWTRFGVELKEIRPVLVNLHTAVIGKRRGVSLRALGAGTPAATSATAVTMAIATLETRPVIWAMKPNIFETTTPMDGKPNAGAKICRFQGII